MNMIVCILTQMEGIISGLMDFVSPFFIAVFAFSIPFLYTVRLSFDEKYKSTIVSEEFKKTGTYRFFWAMNIISFVLIITGVFCGKIISDTIVGYLLFIGVIFLNTILFFAAIICLYKTIVKFGYFQYASEQVNQHLINHNALEHYKETYTLENKKAEKKQQRIQKYATLVQRILNANIFSLSKIIQFITTKRDERIKSTEKKLQTKLYEVQIEIDKENQTRFEQIEKVWRYAICNQDNDTFNKVQTASQYIIRYYQYINTDKIPVVYPLWLYTKLFNILKNALTNAETKGFDTQLASVLLLFVDRQAGSTLSFVTLRFIDEIVCLASDNMRHAFITQFFKFAEDYYLSILQRDEVADFNKRNEANKLIPFINNAPLVFALFIYILRAKLFVQNCYKPLLETENYVGIQTTHGSKHLYRMNVEDIIQLYLTARYALTGYAFVFVQLYPLLLNDQESLLKPIDEYTAFLLLKQGKESLSAKITVTTYDIPNELLTGYMKNIRNRVSIIKRDFQLMGMFRLDKNITDEDFNGIESALKVNKNKAIREQSISNDKEQKFVDESKTHIQTAFNHIACLFQEKLNEKPGWLHYDIAPITTNIDKRALIENPDIDAHSLLEAPAQMYVMNLKYALYKALSTLANKEKSLLIDDMSYLEEGISKLVGIASNDYLYINCQLPYFRPEEGRRLKREGRTLYYEGNELKEETGAYYLENLQQCLLIINKNDIFVKENKVAENANTKSIGDSLFNTWYSFVELNQNTKDAPQVSVTLSPGVVLYYNPNAEVYIIRVNQRW